MTEIYLIRGTEEVLLKIKKPIPLIRNGQKKIIFNNFLQINY